MKKLTLNTSNVPQIIAEIISIVNSTIDSDSFESLAKDFIQIKIKSLNKSPNKKIEIIKVLNDFSFYNYSLYDRDSITDSDLFTIILYLSSIKGELIDGLTNGPDYDNKPGLLQRQASPPVSAYKYVGNNKTDITYSKRSYGLLFE